MIDFRGRRPLGSVPRCCHPRYEKALELKGNQQFLGRGCCCWGGCLFDFDLICFVVRGGLHLVSWSLYSFNETAMQRELERIIIHFLYYGSK